MTNSKQIRKPEGLAQYRSLSHPLKTLVRLLALNVDFCRQYLLLDCITELGTGFTKGRKWTATTVKNHVDTLLEKGLIVKSPKGVGCSRSIMTDVVHDTLLSDDVRPLASALRNVIQAHRGVEIPKEYRSFKEVIREIQIAVLTGCSETTLHEIIFVSSEYFPMEYKDDNPFLLLFNNPFNPGVMDRLDPSIRFAVLNCLINAADRGLVPANEALEYFHRSRTKETPGNFVAGFLVSCFLRGMTDRVKEVLADYEPSSSYAFNGWLEFIKGNNEQALENFNAHIDSTKKPRGKRRVHIAWYPGFFFLLALIKSNENENLLTAMAQIDSAKKSRDQDEWDRAMCAFEPVVMELLSGVESSGPSYFPRHPDPLISFMYMLVMTWRDKEKSKSHTRLLTELRDRARTSGYLWLAAEMSALLSTLGRAQVRNSKLADELHARCNTLSFVTIVKEEPKWEKSLRALINIGKNEGQQPTEVDAGQRLVWLLSHGEYYNRCTFTPRLQKKTKKGGWTNGRAVAMKNLYENYDTMPGLTDQDKRVCSTIYESSHRGGYGYYGHTIEYHFDKSKALPALTDHPLLFLEENPGVRAELVMGEPEVRVIRKKGKIELTLSPMPDKYFDQDILVVRDTPTRFKVVRLDEAHRRVSALVGEGISIPDKAESMARQAIDALSSMVTIHSDLPGIGDVTDVAADPRPHVHIMPFEEGIRIEFLVKPFESGGTSFKPGKGGRNVLAGIAGKKIQAVRDLKREKELAESVVRACPGLGALEELDWEFIADDPEESLELLLELKTCDQEHVMEWPQGEKMKVKRETDFGSLSMKISKEKEWFKATGSLEIDDKQSIDLKKLLEMLGKATGRFVPLDDGTFLAITGELKKRLEELRAFSTAHGKGVRFPQLAAPALEGLTHRLTSLETDKAWKAQVKRMTDVIQPQVPGTLQARLRDYQVEGFNWLARLAHWGVGGCLADDMGLGKTVQAIAAVLPGAASGPTLVVAPLSVMANWLDECRRFAPTLRPTLFGPGNRQQLLDDLGPFDLLIASYGLLQVEAEMLAGVKWQTVILDEAQAIKNMKTKRSRAAMNLSAETRIITTGTPVENHLDELWTLFNFLNPGLLGSYKRFNEVFAVPIERDGDRQARDRLRKLIRPFILRRMKTDVLQELPAKTEVTLHVEMSAQEEALYEAQRLRALESIQAKEEGPGQKHLRILAEIMKLRRLCCNPDLLLPDCNIESSKLRVFRDVLRELLDNNHKALVFSQFVDHLAILREHLEEEKIPYQYLDGSTPMKKRRESIEAFQGGAGDVFLISLKAGGSGLNLTAADYVIHMDPWWNPAVEDQASDRAHRIGQERPVTVYRLVTKDSIEEMIVDLHKEKRDLASSLLSGSDTAGRISAEELLGLLHGKS